jgi:hypothetical protein
MIFFENDSKYQSNYVVEISLILVNYQIDLHFSPTKLKKQDMKITNIEIKKKIYWVYFCAPNGRNYVNFVKLTNVAI